MDRIGFIFIRRAKVKVLYYSSRNISIFSSSNGCRHHLPHYFRKYGFSANSVRDFSGNVLKAKENCIRNIGIMAHIDAGKTTTTERFLYLSGVIQSPGEVHHGDTVTDYLPQERERGITIQSAVVSFEWNDCSINLIDTPGHVDFTFEVERSLRVVDSAIAILDSSAGVEAQTLTVWRQATDNRLPRLIFLNKMDKISASLTLCLDSIKSKLKSTPLLLQLPVYEQRHTGPGSGLIGVVDLVTLQRIEYDASSKGAKYVVRDVSNDKGLVKKRCELIEQVADLDNYLAELVIENESLEKIKEVDVQSAIKRITLKNDAVPILLGSSYKHVGVQPLMDAIVRYLPYPTESRNEDPVIEAYGSELCSFAFKTIHDRQLGPLTFLRVFGGNLSPGQKIYNVSRNKIEKIGKIYLPLANDFKEIPKLYNGEVAVVSGLKETVTGDTLTSTNLVCSSVQKRLAKIKTKLSSCDSQVENEVENIRPVLLGVRIPEPVFFCSIEPASLSHQKGLDEALACLQREDPSLHVSVDPDTSQTVLSGMGELHLEITHERIKSDFKVDAYLGKLMVAYKETIISSITHRLRFERKFGDQPKQAIVIELQLQPKDTKNNGGPTPILRKGIGKDIQEHLSIVLSEKQFRLIQNGVESALRCGPKLGFPVIEVQAVLNYFEIIRGTTDTVIEAGAANCMRQILRDGSIVLLEPIVSLEVTVDENYQRHVLEDLSRRKFLLHGVDQKHGNKIIIGHTALSELMGYSTSLRTVSSGMGTFSIQFSHYNRVNNVIDEAKIIKQVQGF